MNNDPDNYSPCAQDNFGCCAPENYGSCAQDIPRVSTQQTYECCDPVDFLESAADEPAVAKGSPAPAAMAYVLWGACWLILAYAILYGMVGSIRWFFGLFGVY